MVRTRTTLRIVESSVGARRSTSSGTQSSSAARQSCPRMIESLRFSDNVSSVKYEQHIEAALHGIKIAPFRVDVLALQGDLLAMDEV
jgi:hypothetical protein